MLRNCRNLSFRINLGVRYCILQVIYLLYIILFIIKPTLAREIQRPKLIQSKLDDCPSNPNISFLDDYRNKDNNCRHGFQTLLFENNVQEISNISICGDVVLTCRSSDPVGWQYHGPEYASLENAITSVTPARITSGDWSTDKMASCFEVTLKLKKSISFRGRYSCALLQESVNQNSVSFVPLQWNNNTTSSVYLYGWLANPKPAPVKSLAFRGYYEAVIPCLSKNSTLPAKLFHVNTTHVSKLEDKYDSRFGFHIHRTSAEAITGTYQCQPDESESWNVTVLPYSEVGVLSKNISIGYDDKEDCYICTNGDMESLTILPCDNPFHCDLLLEANKDPLSTQVTSSKQQRNKTCNPTSSDLVICRDGNNYQYSLFVQPVKGTVTTLDKTTFADLDFTNKKFEDRQLQMIYVSDTFDIFCKASQHVFSNGLKLLVEYKNGSKYADDIILRTTNTASEGYYHNQWRINFTSTDIRGIYCSAPYIGTKGWRVEKLEYFYGVKYPIPVEIIAPSEVTFTENAKKVAITCVAKSEPVSEIKWSKDGIEFFKLNEYNNKIFSPSYDETSKEYVGESTVRSSIVFEAVKGPDLDASGTWVCRAFNDYGEVNHTIKVTVGDSNENPQNDEITSLTVGRTKISTEGKTRVSTHGTIYADVTTNISTKGINYVKTVTNTSTAKTIKNVSGGTTTSSSEQPSSFSTGGIMQNFPDEAITPKSLQAEKSPYEYFLLILLPAAVFSALAGATLYSRFKKKKIDQEPLQVSDSSDDGDSESNEVLDILVHIHRIPYDEDKYRIARDDLEIQKFLKKGQFGIVNIATLKPMEMPVVVKRPVMTDERAITSFSDELIIFSHIQRFGKHKHVVHFLGAVKTYDPSTHEGELISVLEKCISSLEDYLKENRGLFEQVYAQKHSRKGSDPEVSGIQPSNPYVQISSAFDIPDLIRWSFEIAAAMQHLISLGVIHRDLATRNVLLTNVGGILIAKVTDFGLSRVGNGAYVQVNNTSLPWQHLAAELLLMEKMVFSEATDVYAFGTTLWEMFTLGEVPYDNCPFGENIVMQITTAGLRHPPPKYDEDGKMYEIMKSCWREPKYRPKFSQLASWILDFMPKEQRAQVDPDIYIQSRAIQEYVKTFFPQPQNFTNPNSNLSPDVIYTEIQEKV